MNGRLPESGGQKQMPEAIARIGLNGGTEGP